MQADRKSHFDGYVSVDREQLEAVLKECFWGDYSITVEEVLRYLDEGDKHFLRFFIGRIVANSSIPSVYLELLFSKETLRQVLPSMVLSGRAAERLSLAEAVIFNTIWEEEPSWMRM